MTVVYQQMNISNELSNEVLIEEPTILNPCQIFWNQVLRKLPNVLLSILRWNDRNRTGSFDCVPSILNKFLKSLWFLFILSHLSLLCQPQLTHFSPVSHFYTIIYPILICLICDVYIKVAVSLSLVFTDDYPRFLVWNPSQKS